MSAASVSYSTCCQQGAVALPSDHLADGLTPSFLLSKNFRKNIRTFNNAVLFTSTAAKPDKTVLGNGGAWTYRIKGSLTHLIGSLLPVEGAAKTFGQMFIFGDQAEEELALRKPTDSSMNIQTLATIQAFLYHNNPFAKLYKAAEAILAPGIVKTIKIKSLQRHGRNTNRYNYPTCSQIAAILPGDGVVGAKDRDIILHRQSGELQRISELNTNYFSLCYPLFFM
ncbi:uncharacterized protein MELLADRAFT_35436, partial [Melampsora larici-populina 98AG31]